MKSRANLTRTMDGEIAHGIEIIISDWLTGQLVNAEVLYFLVIYPP